MKKKILVSIAVFVLFFVAGTILKARAETKGASGWLWGGSEDASIPGIMKVIDGNETGVGYISMSSSTDGSSVPYEVTVDENGDLGGYAWSDGIGWISFVDDDISCSLDTDIPDCAPAKVVNNSKVTGYARIVGIKNASGIGNSGGWKGYMRFMDAAIDPSTGEFADDAYAWNGETLPSSLSNDADGLGWISLKGAKIPCVENKHLEWVSIDPCPSSDGDVCGTQTITHKCSQTGQSCGKWPSGYVDDSDCDSVGEKPADEQKNCGTCDTSGKWQETKPQQ